VRSAEEQLHSASALIGVAVANMLPNLTVSAGAGYTSTSLATLFTGPSLFWNVAGNVAQPVFDGLTLLHEERAAQAVYQESAWTYRSTVVGALQNVADSLRAIQNDADALRAARAFEKAAKISLTLSQQQMQTGQANILFLLNAQITYEQAVLQVVQAQAARVADVVALYTALGGGWRNRAYPPAPEQVLDVATDRPKEVAAPDGGWLPGLNSLWNHADASDPKKAFALASAPTPAAANDDASKNHPPAPSQPSATQPSTPTSEGSKP
jgi:outer membrane protein TolC